MNSQNDRHPNPPYTVMRVSPGTKNYFFGFHDLVQTNANGNLALALEVEDITHPPLPGETCVSGVIDLSDLSNFSSSSNFRAIHRTAAWNYPQGARQQWIGDSDLFLCNDRGADGRIVCRVSDACVGKVVDTLPFSVHCCNAKTRKTFGLNYDRIHACGGYGYAPGVSQTCLPRIADIPSNDGIFIGDLETKTSHLLVSIAEVAACGELCAVRTGYPHYLTHLMLNPGGTRLCFLHRYRVPDGGETTRLMTVGTDGSNLRCLAKGFLSHFTWIAEDEIFIWGKNERRLSHVRELSCMRIPGVLQCVFLAKACMRCLRKMRGDDRPFKNGRIAQDKAFMIVKDADVSMHLKNGVGVLTEDGHPMACPIRLKRLVSDTYPNAVGDRWLMFYDVETQTRTSVGQFRRLFATPDPCTFDIRASQKGLDCRILKQFPQELYLFTRSGYHADLHPRWAHDGKTVFFDSIHEGTRQIYGVKIQ